MPHHHYQRTQHRFVSIRSVNGRCTENVRHARGVVRCGLLPSDPCHRFYACRGSILIVDDRSKACGLDFPSCESRDRHEANVHGDGW